ncbi:MAG: hypothetical protein FWC43_04595 [Planctomycetaceae bacterium]|nr:hypothetical protein [Planctomycetaceae bacterium]
MPELFSCKITITQGGQPLQDALVDLAPEEAALGWTITGITDAKGIATIKTQGIYDGVPAGAYKVCVSKAESAPSKFPPPTESATAAPAAWDEWRRNVETEIVPRYSLVKPEYNDKTQTPHSITVTKGKNNATFDVGEAIKEEIK